MKVGSYNWDHCELTQAIFMHARMSHSQMVPIDASQARILYIFHHMEGY